MMIAHGFSGSDFGGLAAHFLTQSHVKAIIKHF